MSKPVTFLISRMTCRPVGAAGSTSCKWTAVELQLCWVRGMGLSEKPRTFGWEICLEVATYKQGPGTQNCAQSLFFHPVTQGNLHSLFSAKNPELSTLYLEQEPMSLLMSARTWQDRRVQAKGAPASLKAGVPVCKCPSTEGQSGGVPTPQMQPLSPKACPLDHYPPCAGGGSKKADPIGV